MSVIEYTSKRGYTNGCNKNLKCQSCAAKTRKNVKRIYKNTKHLKDGKVRPRYCPCCGKEIIYKNKRKRCLAENANSLCSSCACKKREHEKHSEKRYNMEIINGDKIFFRFCPTCNKKIYYNRCGHRNQLEGKECRECHILSKKYIFPNYNKIACEFFNKINVKFNLNGKHALNGGE